MIWLLLLILLACSGTVSASETALFALNQQTLHAFRREGRIRRRVYAMMQEPHRVLMTVLMANTTVNVAIFTVSFFAFREFEAIGGGTAALAAAAATIITPLAVIVFGEMLPKAVALTSARQLAPLAGSLIWGLQVVFGPVQWILAVFLVEPITRLLSPAQGLSLSVSTEELRLLVEQSAREGVITSSENEMLQAVVALADVSVREVMTPRVDIRSLPINTAPDAALQAFRDSGLRRMPVHGKDLDDIRGVLYARELFLDPHKPIRRLMRRPSFVPEQVNLIQVLRHFRTENAHLAVVVDEFGGTVGLVTIENIVRWVVGELPDADTPGPATTTERIDENTYRLSGNLSVRDWADRFGVTEAEPYVDTIGGLILARLGRVPRVGDTIRIRNLTLTVENLRGRRIEQVRLHRDANGRDVA